MVQRPYDAFDVDGELKKYNPCYFTEELELRSMYLDFKGADSQLYWVFGLHRLLTGKKIIIKHKEQKLLRKEKHRL